MAGRRHNPDLRINWKIVVPATLAGRVEAMLHDSIHNKPLYGARGDLIVALLEMWVARETGRPIPEVPTLADLISRSH